MPSTPAHTSPLIPLPSRAILALEAKNLEIAQNFLQPLITQDVFKLKTQPLIYGAHLTRQGRLITDMFIFIHQNLLCLDIHHTQLLPLAKIFQTYNLNGEITFHDLTKELFVYAGTPPNNITQAKNYTPHPHSWPDPRLSTLGHRLYNTTPQQTNRAATAAPTEETYHEFRISLGVPDGILDAPPQKVLPAELGLDFLNGISYKKGCYVGQEVTARLHFKSSPPKSLWVLSGSLFSPLSPSNSLSFPFITTKTGKKIGWLGSSCKNKALAVLKKSQIVPSEGIVVEITPLPTPTLPLWWGHDTVENVTAKK